mmetsp:Transcript_19463/g.39209  ORF Transcript_19463/g.39209 Transcript_19463/m.39209 type:complete len:274 (+) Transcript_19463:777-1598(+)
MSTSMEQNASPLGHPLHIFDQTVEIQTARGIIIISILLHLQSGVGENGNVVAPSRVGDVNVLVSELGENFAEDTESSRSGEGLDAGYAFFFEGCAILSVYKSQCEVDKVGTSSNSRIFVIQLLFDQFLFRLPDDGKNEWISLITSIGTDADVDLLRKVVVQVRLCQTNNRIRRSHWEILPRRRMLSLLRCRRSICKTPTGHPGGTKRSWGRSRRRGGRGGSCHSGKGGGRIYESRWTGGADGGGEGCATDDSLCCLAKEDHGFDFSWSLLNSK